RAAASVAEAASVAIRRLPIPSDQRRPDSTSAAPASGTRTSAVSTTPPRSSGPQQIREHADDAAHDEPGLPGERHRNEARDEQPPLLDDVTDARRGAIEQPPFDCRPERQQALLRRRATSSHVDDD